jgi:hypothetical protein
MPFNQPASQNRPPENAKSQMFEAGNPAGDRQQLKSRPLCRNEERSNSKIYIFCRKYYSIFSENIDR